MKKRAPKRKLAQADSPPVHLSRRPKRTGAQSLNRDTAERLFRATLGEQWDAIKKRIAVMRRDQLERELVGRRIVSKEEAHQREPRWLRIRYAYCLQEERRIGLGIDTPKKVAERIEKLDYDREVQSYYIDLFTGEKPKGDTVMATKKKGKTIGQRMVEILRLKKVPTNAAIVTMVKKDFPDSAFNSAHVSWYKGAFNAGKLPGQTKGEKYTQPKVRETKDAPAKKAASKKAPKRVPKKAAKKVSKKKATKKAPKRKTAAKS